MEFIGIILSKDGKTFLDRSMGNMSLKFEDAYIFSMDEDLEVSIRRFLEGRNILPVIVLKVYRQESRVFVEKEEFELLK